MVQLWGGDAEVKQEADKTINGHLVQDASQVDERRSAQLDPIAEAGEAPLRRREGLVVAVKADDTEVNAELQDRLGVAATADRGVQHDATRNVGQGCQDLFDHHWLVVEPGRSPPAVVIAMVRHCPFRRSGGRDDPDPVGSSFDRPPIGWRTSGCLPESGWMASGRSRGLPSCRPGDGPGTSRSWTGRRGHLVSSFTLPLGRMPIGQIPIPCRKASATDLSRPGAISDHVVGFQISIQSMAPQTMTSCSREARVRSFSGIITRP